MSWFRKPERKLQADQRREVPPDVFEKCPGCGEILYRAKLEQNEQVCPECGHHFRIRAGDYLRILLDAESWEEHDSALRSEDPLEFTDIKPYRDRLAAAEARSPHGDAVVTGTGTLNGIPVCIAVMDFSFIGGSMGSVVGEKIARIGRYAERERIPLIIVSTSGGARMMEGILSLMQMAKTASVLARLHEAGIPYISILTDPTTGGVTASFSMLGDVNLAEPGALIGFAGPRVIEQTIKQELPSGFQRSEFLLEHGMIDAIVDRRRLKMTVARLLSHMLGLPAPKRESPANGASDAVAAGQIGASAERDGRSTE
ncbi:MAG TPA: acetyl-CoA carboxylase, carboxyltransferase subunit beta [Longimicrobiales bacterium]|nr:acetyl-CoA carboxylase, carboxyltransferase subunit beta [Longimicrobiales bacterium]